MFVHPPDQLQIWSSITARIRSTMLPARLLANWSESRSVRSMAGQLDSRWNAPYQDAPGPQLECLSRTSTLLLPICVPHCRDSCSAGLLGSQSFFLLLP